MTRMLTRGISFCIALLFSTGVLAQEQLSEIDIERYIESIQRLESMSERINRENPQDAANMAELWIEGDTDALLDHLQEQEYFPELRETVQQAGFDDAEEWVDKAQRITRAYTALEIDQQGQDFEAQMEEGLRQIQQAEYLSEEQKAALTEQLKASQEHLAKLESVPEEDKAVVANHLEELRQQFEQNAAESEWTSRSQ